MKFRSRFAVVVGSLLGTSLPLAGPRPAGGADSPAATPPPAAENARKAPTSLFDPQRHMRVSEVKPRMKGYGLSVFSGTKIERFEVEVISVLKNFNTKADVVLIKCRGRNLEHTGAVAGMSGSPIYLKDDQGRDRMIGAFAYGWPLTKDPLAGVQPIEYMLEIRGATDTKTPEGGRPPAAAADAGEPGGPADGGDPSSAAPRLRWSLADSPYFPGSQPNRLGGASELAARHPNTLLGGGGDATQLQPLATPLMTAGVSQELLNEFAPLFKAAGLVPLQAGGGGAGAADPNEPEPKLEPGSVLGVPMILGDMDMTALGTTTEVLGDRVFGFGHPFNNEGDVVLPMGTGRISHIIPNLTTSFKLGALAKTTGRLVADEQAGVAGQQGAAPPMVPIDIRVVSPGGSPDRTYHFDAALHPRFTPLICGLAINAAISGSSDLPQYNTLDYDLNMEFENGRTIRVKNRAVNASPMQLFADAGMPMLVAADNPFGRVMVKKVTGTIHVKGEAREAQIVEVTVPKTKYRPGETVNGFVTYKPFRADERIMPIELQLPADLPEGNYQLVIADHRRYLQDEQQSKPFRFTAERIGEVFDVLSETAAVRHNALYVRLVRQGDGVAVGRTAMPQLPSSRRTVLLGGGRSNTTRFVSSTVKIIATDLVMTGAAEFVLTVDAKARVDHGKPGPAGAKAGAEGGVGGTDERNAPRPATAGETPGGGDAVPGSGK